MGVLFCCKERITMNTQLLQDLVHGNFGRKIAYANYETVDDTNVVKIIQSGITALNWNRPIIKYLKNYMKGDCPTRYRTKTVRDDICNYVIENHAFEIVQFKNAQTNAEPIQYISLSKDEKISFAVDKLNTYARISHKHRKDLDSGEWTSAVGFGYKAAQRTNDEIRPFRVISPDPMHTVVVYSAITEEPLLAMQELKDENNERYWLCYDSKYEYRYQGGNIIPLQVTADGLTATKRLHMYADIPIVEYPNNADRISDIELVIDLLDAINNMQSNRMDSVEQQVQSFMKFINCDIDYETFEEMKKYGALMIKSTKDKEADVEIMEQTLDQTQTQVAKQDLWDNVKDILAIPRIQSGSDGGSTTGATELRQGWDFAKSRAKIKDQYIIDSEMRLAKVMVGLIQSAKGINECNITEMDFTAQIIHNPTDNLVARVNALSQLLACGVHPKISMETVALWSDTEKAYNLSKETLDKKQYSDKVEEIDVNENIDTPQRAKTKQEKIDTTE